MLIQDGCLERVENADIIDGDLHGVHQPDVLVNTDVRFILDSGLHQKNPLEPQGFGGFSDDGGEMFPLFYPYCAVSLNRRQHS